MKNQILSITSALLISSALILTGCGKRDTSAPEITLNGDATVSVDFKYAYNELGATATDKDGKDNESDISSSIVTTGAVNTFSAEAFMVKYNVSDEAGNASTEVSRTVNVKIKATNMASSYSVTDVSGGFTNSYSDAATLLSSDENKIIVSKFAFYDNAGVYMIFSGVNGTTVTVPSQINFCGSPVTSRQFSGTGTVSKDGKTITINYTVVTNGTPATGIGTYTKL